MTRGNLNKAIVALNRFKTLADAVKVAEPSDKEYADLGPSKLTGALRRASMDLTRALAELRRTR